jgi:hypothetical protein
MGLLDPKVDKDRTFELLKKKDAIKAELQFQGGHDEGSIEWIKLTLSSGEEVELEDWYCGGYTLDPEATGPPYEWVPMSTPANEDEELSELLQGPIDAEFGSWGSVPSTIGTLTWDVFTRKATMSYSQDVETEFSREVI